MNKTAQWDPVRELMKGTLPVSLGKRIADWFYHSPQSLLNYLSYYKFCGKMIGSSKKILHIDCKEGLGTYLLHIECGNATGLVKEKKELEIILQSKFSNDFFLEESFSSFYKYDAVVNLEGADEGYGIHQIKDEGLALLGIGDFTRTLEKDYLRAKELEKKGKETFRFLFSFSAQNETIKPGIILGSNYYFFIGSKKI